MILLSLSIMETTLGSVQFLSITFQLLFLTTFIQMIIYHAISKKLNMHSNTTMTTSATMGFSSVILGLLTVHAHHAETIECILFPGLQIDTSNAPMLAYLLASCLLTEASILNHFIAGFVGFVIGVGGLDWLSGYWLNCIFFISICTYPYNSSGYHVDTYYHYQLHISNVIMQIVILQNLNVRCTI